VEIDARVGGKYRITEKRNGDSADHGGEYLVIDRPNRLAFTFGVPSDSEDKDNVTLDFVVANNGCLISLRHEMNKEWESYSDRTRDGWATILEGLEQTIQK
jgi:uncharacterized protein YndB with AHSA1/START domain